MSKKVFIRLAAAGVSLLLIGAVAVSTVDKLVIEDRTVDSLGGLVEKYIKFREQMGPIVPPGVMYQDVAERMSIGDWSFLKENWFFTFDDGVLYVPAKSELAKELKLPVRIQMREDLTTGQIYIFSVPVADGKSGLFAGLAIFAAPEFMPYEKDFPLDRYVFDELAPRRVVWEITLKPEADAWADLFNVRQTSLSAKDAQAGMPAPQMMMMSVPEEHANDLWLYLDPQNEQISLNVFAPEGFTNRVEIYSCTNLISGVWEIAVQNLYPSCTNSVVWDAASEWTNRFFRAGNMDIDSDGDGLPDAREKCVYKTNPDSVDSDSDGLSDAGEIQTYGTSPVNSDSDGDGLPDGWEVQYGLNSLDASGDNGGTGDFDADGAGNYTEYQRGTDPSDAHDVTREISIWEPFVLNAYSLSRSGNSLFVAGNNILTVLDISNPTAPVFLASTNVTGLENSKLIANGDYVYGFESRGTGLLVFDCTISSEPRFAAQISMPTGKVSYAEFSGLTVEDDVLYVWDDSRIEIYSLTNPVNPQWVAEIPDLSSPETNLYVSGMYVDNGILYAGYCGDDYYSGKGFGVWNISNPVVPFLETYISSTNYAV